MQILPAGRSIASIGYVHHSVQEIIVEGFNTIEHLCRQANFGGFDIWAPVIAHNVLYATCLDCLCGGTTAYIQKHDRAKPKELKKTFGGEFINPCPDNFLLSWVGEHKWKYPKSQLVKKLRGDELIDSCCMKSLTWHEIELPPNDVSTQTDEFRPDEKFRAIGFWQALTRVCDQEVFMNRYMGSQALVLTPKEVYEIEFLVNNLRNPVAHTQPNASATWTRDEVIESMRTVQRATLFLVEESNMSVTLDMNERDYIRKMAI